MNPRRYSKGGQIAVVARGERSESDTENGIVLGTGEFLAEFRRTV
jgi:hypothetical protein